MSDVEVFSSGEDEGGGGGGGGGAKRRRVHKTKLERWAEVKEFGCFRVGPADEAVWLGDKDRGAWCLVCGKLVLVGTTFSNISKHPVSASHKERAAAAKAHPSVAAMLASPSPVNPSSEEAKLNARAVLALSSVRFMPRSSISAAYGELRSFVPKAFVLGVLAGCSVP